MDWAPLTPDLIIVHIVHERTYLEVPTTVINFLVKEQNIFTRKKIQQVIIVQFEKLVKLQSRTYHGRL